MADGTGDLGGRIVKSLLHNGAHVRVIVMLDADSAKVERLYQLGVEVVHADMTDVASVTKACIGVSCVVSALQGLRDVTVNIQSVLL